MVLCVDLLLLICFIVLINLSSGDWNCLSFSNYNKSFSDSQTICQNETGHLVSVPNATVNNFISSKLISNLI